MPKFGDLGSKFSKTNDKFEISTFKKQKQLENSRFPQL